MITHFAEVELPTPSIPGVKQFYARLGFETIEESEDRIAFAPALWTRLSFRLSHEPIAAAHLAFEVPYASFYETAAFLESRLGPALAWPDGAAVRRFESGVNVYYRDGDGHLLEWIAHEYLQADALQRTGACRQLYLREVGLPVENVREASAWLRNTLGLALFQAGDDFAFARGGTAHAVVVSKLRKWIPIRMAAVPPQVRIVWGAADPAYISRTAEAIRQAGIAIGWHPEECRLTFEYSGYPFEIRYTPEVTAEKVSALRLPQPK